MLPPLRRALALTLTSLLASCGGGGGSTDHDTTDTTRDPYRLDALALAAPTKVDGTSQPRLVQNGDMVRVWVTLKDAPLAARHVERSRALGLPVRSKGDATVPTRANAAAASLKASLKAELQQYEGQLKARQQAAAGQLEGLGAKVLGRTHKLNNAIAVRVPRSALQSIAKLPSVQRIRPVVDFTPSAAPLVTRGGVASAGASGRPGPSAGADAGRGVRIAILDTGIDYTHAHLGGAGTAEAYAAAYGTDAADARNTTPDGLFPTAKVVAGTDFVGDTWTGDESDADAALEPDDDPIDANGHGTHVADIAAGTAGIAPGASLVAVKVCATSTPRCNGVALLQGLDYAVDPNGDGDFDDAVDIINLSLGTPYGQIADDAAYAVDTAVSLGVVVAAAAGNEGDRPFVVSTPSIAPGAISVAQTTMPDATAQALVVDAPSRVAGRYADTATLAFAPVTGSVSAEVVVAGRACDGDAWPASVQGRIALIDRGDCSVSGKIDRAATAGAVGVLIGLTAPGDPVTFARSEGYVFVPSLVIPQSLATALKDAAAAGTVRATLSAANRVAQDHSIATTSSRGPGYDAQGIKPEIGAPGETVSAIAGSGTGTEAFGGTSGATPVVSGAAALVLQGRPTLPPLQVKALLMNTADTAIDTNRATKPGERAPITRIGAGQVRPERARAANVIAWNPAQSSAALSFGVQRLSRGQRTVEQVLRLQNLGSTAQSVTLASQFRDPADAASGAVRVELPSGALTLAPGASQDVKVRLVLDASRLPEWQLDGGPLGGDGARLQSVEFDGRIEIRAGAETLSVPWHVLPRRSADLWLDQATVRAGQPFSITNAGLATARVDVFALTGVSPDDGQESTPGSQQPAADLRAVGARLVEPGVLQFAISTYGRRSHPLVPAGFQVLVDVDRDGQADVAVYNAEEDGFGHSGRTVVAVSDLRTGAATAYYYALADLDSGNLVYTLPLSALGVDGSTPLQFSVVAYDNYFYGTAIDVINGMTYTPATPRYTPGAVPPAVAGRSAATVTTAATAGGAEASPSQQGFLVLYQRDAGSEADLIRVTP